MESKPKMLVFDEVAEHNQKHDCWLIISGKVYNVTTFLDDHPGGDEILLTVTGKDATSDFEEADHSNEAKEMMKNMYVGEIDVSTIPKKRKITADVPTTTEVETLGSSSFVFQVLKMLIPVILAVMFYSIYSRNA